MPEALPDYPDDKEDDGEEERGIEGALLPCPPAQFAPMHGVFIIGDKVEPIAPRCESNEDEGRNQECDSEASEISPGDPAAEQEEPECRCGRSEDGRLFGKECESEEEDCGGLCHAVLPAPQRHAGNACKGKPRGEEIDPGICHPAQVGTGGEKEEGAKPGQR